MPGFLIPQISASPLTITDVFVVNSEAAMLALSTAQVGDVAIRTDINKSFILSSSAPATLSNWKELLTPPDAVLSVDGQTGSVTLSSTYQALDADLTAVAALTGAGFAKRISNDTWELDTSTYLNANVVDAKGDLIAGTADNTIDKVTVGANNTVLVANSSASTGMNWSASLSGLTVNSPIILSPEERCNVVASAATGTINFDVLTSTIWYYTSNASANHTLNFRGNSETTLNSILSTGDSISAIWLNTNGATPYRPTVFQIDGSSVTPQWAGGTAPSAGNASSIDAYSFTIIKTAETPTYVVFAGQVRFA